MLNPPFLGPLRLQVDIEQWPLRHPFRITGYTFEAVDALVVTLEKGGYVGRGEAQGVYFRDDRPKSMCRQIEQARTAIESGLSRVSLQTLLPAGGARNAVDCALWDLEAKLTGQAVWRLVGLPEPRPLVTTYTCPADDPAKMASLAQGFANARAIKLKLTGEAEDADRVRAVRESRPEVWLSVDANQGFTRESLGRLMPTLIAARVALIEQPFAVGHEADLDGFLSPIPLAADETVHTLGEVEALLGRFNVLNIKLDKCGGLTEGLAMARAARRLGLEIMVGNMLGTSLAMAPAFLLGQLCSVVDLDGPMFLKTDRPNAVEYLDGTITCSDEIWGSGSGDRR